MDATLTPPMPGPGVPASPTGPPLDPSLLGSAPPVQGPQPGALLQLLSQIGPNLTPPPAPDADPVSQAIAGDGPPLPNNAGRTAHRIAMAASHPDLPSPITPNLNRPQLAGADDRTKTLLTAPTAGDFTARTLSKPDTRKQIAAGAVVALVAQQISNDDPNDLDPTGTQGAAWDMTRLDYAVRRGLVGYTKDGQRLQSLYRRYLDAPDRLAPDDVAQLAGMVSSFGKATQGIVGPQLTDQGVSVKRVDFLNGQAVLRLQGDQHAAGLARQAVAATPAIPDGALAKLDANPAYVHTPDGLAVATAVGIDPTKAANDLRVLGPIPVGGAQRWVTRAPIARGENVNALAQTLQTDGSVIEIHHAPQAPHVATQPGQYLVVTLPNGQATAQARHVLADNSVDATRTQDYLGVERRTVQPDGEVLSHGVRQLAVTLPDDMTAKAAKALATGLGLVGAANPVFYTHGQPAGWMPVTEHHYTGPADQVVIHRSAAPADPAAQHAYNAWMLPADAKKLGTGTHDLNAASPAGVFAAGPDRQQDESFIANGELRLHVAQPDPTAKIEMPNRWWNSTVGGEPTRFFVLDHPPADLPSISLGASPDAARGTQPATSTSVEGKVVGGKTVTELHVPMAANGLNLDALHNAVRTLTRYGLAVPPAQVRIVGEDGQQYTMTGAAHVVH